MALDFPASPTVNQQFTAAGVTWIWDGAKWLPAGLAPTVIGGINDNRIINGDMRIDQRNNGASGTAGGYTVDRWAFSGSQGLKITWQRGGPQSNLSGCQYYLSFFTSGAYTPGAGELFNVQQTIEADMVGDFLWGTPTAQSATLSFWTFSSSLTGTFSGSIRNAVGTRSYPFTFSLPAAGTWTRIVITIPGDTAGTWVLGGNAGAITVGFDLGSGATFRGPANAWVAANYVGATGAVNSVGTASNSFIITGVKLEIGSVATPFNRQSLAKSMIDCQRYYQARSNDMWSGNITNAVGYYYTSIFPVQMRTAPTIVASDGGVNGFPAGVPITQNIAAYGFQSAKTANVTGNGGFFITNYTASAEL